MPRRFVRIRLPHVWEMPFPRPDDALKAGAGGGWQNPGEGPIYPRWADMESPAPGGQRFRDRSRALMHGAYLERSGPEPAGVKRWMGLDPVLPQSREEQITAQLEGSNRVGLFSIVLPSPIYGP